MTADDLEITLDTQTSAQIETLKDDIIFFLSTPAGSLPLSRGFGLDFSVFSEGFSDFRREATVGIVRGLREQFGLSAKTIDITADEGGKIKIKISI